MGARFAFLISAVSIAYGFLLFHLYEVQLLRGSSYLVQAESQDNLQNFQTARRGSIYFADKNGNRMLVASKKGFPEIYAVPKEIGDIEEASHILSLALGTPAEGLVVKLGDKKSNYVSLLKRAPGETLKKIEEVGFKGIYTREIAGRFYPFGDLAAQTLGFVGPDEKANGESGRYGIEKFYNDLLSGVAGTTDESDSSMPGEDLVLTIDPNIQKQAEVSLAKLLGETKALSGSVLVEDPATGKILAMASFPGYDPNIYTSFALKYFLNPAIEHIYEPGSVFKVFTMSAGIDSGKITPDTSFYDSGSVVISGHKIENWDHKAHGMVTMTNVIELSMNTGTAFAVKTMGGSVLASYFKKFGFGEKSGIDLPGELKGNISRLVPKAPAIAFATAGFGQGVSVTPLQLINAVSAIANGGKLMRPYLNSERKPEVIRQVMTPETAAKVTKMMVSAVDKAGVAKIEGFSIAGKTGTAQVPNFIKGGYTNQVIDTYVGFGPTINPRFVVLFKIDEPPGAPLAGTTVVPAFKEIAQFILRYLDVPQDRIATQ
ncbi:MAG: penicillin-binding protein 2 [Candidatus Liptonbacteria bacterium]|nr:penicillin-binding protein 2 [Candidatus Liptonbacteria bacterium]